jgi:opacity protein-like surface antigen
VEGTIANNQAQQNGSQSSFSNRITVTTPPGSTTSSSTLTNSTVLDSLAERWAVSALARLGWLVDPRDLVYVIGGYTYGGFEWGTRSFGLHGATVGAGWEREIAPGWTLKAEYRYTRFQDRDLEPRASVSTTTQNSGFAGGTQAFLSNVSSTSTDRVSGLDLHALRFGITHYFGATALASAPVAYTKAAPSPPQMWDGVYAGISRGPTWFSAATSTVNHNVSTSTRTLPAGGVTVTNSTTDTATSSSGKDWGAQADIFAGYNFRLGGNFVASLQAEGTIASNQAKLNASQVSVSNSVTGTTTTTTLTAATFIDNVAERWAVSALGRIGWLIDPRDLVYAVGGYTYGGFEWGDRTFGLHGATVGAGWEREVAPGWTMKAEYRYTRFQDRDLPRTAASNSNQASVSAAGAVTTTVNTSTSAITDRVSGLDLHALRFGITHHFGAEALASAPVNAAMVTKAPRRPVGQSWEGLYGGVSFGLTSMRTSTTSTSTEIFNDAFAVPGDAITDVEPVNTAFNTRGRQVGAIADIFSGYNVRFATNVIAGVQFEGSMAPAITRGNGSFGTVFSVTSVETPPGGAAGTSLTTGTQNGSVNFTVESRWMASALARLGWLIDPRLLVYATGGWTYGSFAQGSRVFGLNGPSVGAGIEREVAPLWTVKAEYRYTHFLAKDVPVTTTQAQIQQSGTTTSSFTDVFNEIDRFAVDMHAVRFGITRYFATY